jgi:DNA-binding transcriptional ArsR family regulator
LIVYRRWTIDMDEALAEKLKALAHPARLAILRTLANRGRCVCGEVVEVMPLAQATVSEHLRVLKGAGLIQGRIEGRNSCYCLDPDAIAALRDGVDQLPTELSTGAQRSRESEEAVA